MLEDILQHFLHTAEGRTQNFTERDVRFDGLRVDALYSKHTRWKAFISFVHDGDQFVSIEK
jgi:hypothetical protein